MKNTFLRRPVFARLATILMSAALLTGSLPASAAELNTENTEVSENNDVTEITEAVENNDLTAKTGAAGESGAAGEIDEAGEPAESEAAGETDEAGEPAESEAARETDAAGEPAEAGQSGETGESGAAGEPGENGEADRTGKTLPSGIAYEDLDEAIQNFIRERKDTTVGLAYSVFDESGDIASGYYGYMDRENELPVDEDTVFEWGSGSKILIWISVMQLYEKGQIDLGADIRTYLPEGFLSNQKYDTPITMINLMNHNAGFQETVADQNITSPTFIKSLEEALSAHKPPQIYEPGQVTAYSNWGSSLAAYIVECVSGMPYYEYVHENILDPLGMDKTALFIDLSDNEFVQGHRIDTRSYMPDGKLQPYSFIYVTIYPAGRCTSTFGDFKTLGQALLSKDERLMKKETWEEMFTPTSTFGGTDLGKNFHGLWGVYFGVPTIGHIGRTSGFSSYLLLSPEAGIGSLFINNQGGDLEYTENIRPLIYGDYNYSDYGTESALPKGNYRNSSTVEIGPFKLRGFMNTAFSPLDVSKEFWTLTSYKSVEKVERAYMDFLEVPVWKDLLQRGLVVLAVFSLLFLAVSIAVRLILFLVRLFRKNRGLRPLGIWSFWSSFPPFVVPSLYLALLQLTSHPSTEYKGIFISYFVMCILMTILALYGWIRNPRVNVTKGQRVYNYIVAGILTLFVIEILYWNLFMFWSF